VLVPLVLLVTLLRTDFGPPPSPSPEFSHGLAEVASEAALVLWTNAETEERLLLAFGSRTFGDVLEPRDLAELLNDVVGPELPAFVLSADGIEPSLGLSQHH
jgi:hypothetical protein